MSISGTAFAPLTQTVIGAQKSGMTDIPNWLSEAVGDRHEPKKIAQAIFRSTEWTEFIGEALKEAEEIMHAQRSKIAPAGGFPSYNHEVARAIISRLVRLYPEVYLIKR